MCGGGGGGDHKLDWFYGSFLYIYRMGLLFWVAKISTIFVDMPDIFFGLTVDASWSKHTYEEKKNENTPPPVMLTIQQSNLTIDIAKLDESLSPLW